MGWKNTLRVSLKPCFLDNQRQDGVHDVSRTTLGQFATVETHFLSFRRFRCRPRVGRGLQGGRMVWEGRSAAYLQGGE